MISDSTELKRERSKKYREGNGSKFRERGSGKESAERECVCGEGGLGFMVRRQRCGFVGWGK
jgi:hypothetical protein